MDITREQCTEITEAILLAAQAILDDYGVVIDQRAVRSQYGEHYQIKLSAERLVVGNNGVNLNDKYAKGFLAHAWQHGITDAEAALGSTYNDSRGDRWQVLGYNSRAPKYPFIIKNLSTGKTHKGTESHARHMPSFDPDKVMLKVNVG